MKKITRDTMLIAATAASPYTAAQLLSTTVLSELSPCLSKLGKPVPIISGKNFGTISLTDNLHWVSNHRVLVMAKFNW